MSGGGPTWTSFFFDVDDEYLCYYQSETSSAYIPNETVELAGLKWVAASETDPCLLEVAARTGKCPPQPPPPACPFPQVEWDCPCPGEYALQADSPGDRDAWVLVSSITPSSAPTPTCSTQSQLRELSAFAPNCRRSALIGSGGLAAASSGLQPSRMGTGSLPPRPAKAAAKGLWWKSRSRRRSRSRSRGRTRLEKHTMKIGMRQQMQNAFVGF